MTLCMGTDTSDRYYTEMLIKEVQKHPILYDPLQPGYKDRTRVEAVWQTVGRHLHCTADAARKRWQNLRGSYSRARSGIADDAAAGIKTRAPFYLAEQMSFLEPHMKHNPTFGNVGCFDGTPDTYSTHEALLSQPEPFEEKIEIESMGSDSPATCATPSTPVSCLTPATPASPVTIERPLKREAPLPDSDIDFKVMATQFLASKMQKVDKNSSDMESLKGLLPHMGALSKRNKRTFLRRIYNLVFEMLEEQDAESDSMRSDYI